MLSQALRKITSPGLPDFYQGSELWDRSMVDPDNRRPVDFRRCVQVLEESRRLHSENPRESLREISASWKDGRIKLFLTDTALDFRRTNIGLYQEGAYIPLLAQGEKKECLCSFARQREESWCITVAPRLTTRLTSVERMPLGKRAWLGTSIPLPQSAPAIWQNALTGERVRAAVAPGGQRVLLLAEVMKRFPVALRSAIV